MRLRLYIVAALACSSADCHRSSPPAATPMLSAKVRAAIGQRVYYPTFDSVVVTAGLTSLRASALPRGHREVRIWIGGGFTAPEDLYRFVDDRGRVSGELVRYWGVVPPGSDDSPPGETTNDFILYTLRGSCSRYAVGEREGTCRADFTSAPDWGKALRRAEAEGLWTLPDESSLPTDGSMTLDGWSIVVELRDGARYRAYMYNNPDTRRDLPESAKAARIAKAVRAIDSLVRTPEVVRSYRGVTTGVYRSEFVDCATGARWQFNTDLPGLATQSAIPFQQQRDSTAQYVVEVVGELTPEWLARRWKSKYPQVLQVFKLVSVRPSLDGRC